MVKAKQAEKSEKQEESMDTTDTMAILMDLEGAVVNGRAIAYKVIKDVLASAKVSVTAVMFSRYCLERRPARYVPELLKPAGKKGGDDLVKRITAGLSDAFLNKSVTLSPGVEEMLQAAQESRVAVGLLSGLPKKTLEEACQKLGLSDVLSGTISYSGEEKGYPPADAWLRLAKELAIKPTRSVAVVGGAGACASALAAHMRCIVVPDEYTEFQDFGGSDLLVDKLDASLVPQMLEFTAGLQ